MGAFKAKTVPTTTTSTSAPWQAAQPDLKLALGSAGQLFSDQIGYKPYTGPMNADVSSQTTQGLNGIMGAAQGSGGVLGNTGVGFANNLIQNNGLSADQTGALQALKDTAAGNNLNSVNPYLQKQIDAMNQQISNQVNGAASAAGRYGSGMHTGVLTDKLGNADANILSTNWENERNRQLSASSSLADIYGQGLNRASNMALNGQQISDQLYDPFTRMTGVGDFYDQRAQNQLQGGIDAYNAAQAWPWEQTQRLAAIANGAGALGGTQVGTGTTTRPSALQTTLGAASSGLGLLGKLF